MSSLPCFNSSLEKVYKNLKTIKLIGTAELLLVNILKRSKKIEELTIFSEGSHCKFSFKLFFSVLIKTGLFKNI